MPITSIPTNDRKERFVATAAQTVFPYDFPIYAATDLLVTRLRGNTLTTLINGTDYTVSGVNNQTGGNVTLTTGALADDIIIITSNMPTARAAQFVNGGDLPAAALEAEFNKLRILFQQLTTLQSNALIYPISDLTAPPLPIKEQRANKALAFNAQGEPIPGDYAALSHNHIIGNVTGLQAALEGKANTSHPHAISDVTGLQTALDGKADTSHPHAISDVTGLQTALDSKKVRGTIFDSGGLFLSGNVTLDPSMKGRWIQLMGSGQSLTIPSNSAFFNSEFCYLTTGDNGCTIIQGAGVTLRKAGTTQTGNYSVPPWSVIAIFKNANTNEYLIVPADGTGNNVTFNTVLDSKGNLRDLPVTDRTAAYTAALSDTGGQIRISTGGVTIPAGVFSPGHVFSIVNNSASNQTITQGASVTLRLAGTATTGNRTLAQYGQCTVNCVANNEFIISGPGLT
jgi:hypothetical protein